MTTATLYETDFYAWTQNQVALLREAKLGQLDIANLIEEIDDMGKSQRRELESRLVILLAHLLKWHYQPEQRSRSWEASIQVQRSSLRRLLRDNPSLRPRMREFVDSAYPDAVTVAWGETGLERSVFPQACPYANQKILDEMFFPEAND